MGSGRAVGVVLGVGALAGAAFLFLRSKTATAASAGSPRDRPPEQLPGSPRGAFSTSVESWRSYVEYVARAMGIPTDFVLAWLTVESGGNPCSVGFPGEMDFQGHAPLESGPFQFMSPHDVSEAATSIAQMRASCAIASPVFPGLSRKSPAAEIVKARKAAEAQSRSLTDEERSQHVMAGLNYIAHAMKLIEATGLAWTKTNPGYWALVKAHHGASGWPAAGVAMARAGLGHDPSTWDDLVTGVRASPAYAAAGKHAAEHGGSNPHEVAMTNAGKTMRLAFPKGRVSVGGWRVERERGNYA